MKKIIAAITILTTIIIIFGQTKSPFEKIRETYYNNNDSLIFDWRGEKLNVSFLKNGLTLINFKLARHLSLIKETTGYQPASVDSLDYRGPIIKGIDSLIFAFYFERLNDNKNSKTEEFLKNIIFNSPQDKIVKIKKERIIK